MFDEKELYKETQSIAKVGGWSFDITNQSIFWTDEVFEILELPKDTVPDFEVAMGPYLPKSRQLLLEKIQDAIQNGKTYDLELQLKTNQTHRIIWVRAMGKPSFNEKRSRSLIRYYSRYYYTQRNHITIGGKSIATSLGF